MANANAGMPRAIWLLLERPRALGGEWDDRDGALCRAGTGVCVLGSVLCIFGGGLSAEM